MKLKKIRILMSAILTLCVTTAWAGFDDEWELVEREDAELPSKLTAGSSGLAQADPQSDQSQAVTIQSSVLTSSEPRPFAVQINAFVPGATLTFPRKSLDDQMSVQGIGPGTLGFIPPEETSRILFTQNVKGAIGFVLRDSNRNWTLLGHKTPQTAGQSLLSCFTQIQDKYKMEGTSLHLTVFSGKIPDTDWDALGYPRSQLDEVNHFSRYFMKELDVPETQVSAFLNFVENGSKQNGILYSMGVDAAGEIFQSQSIVPMHEDNISTVLGTVLSASTEYESRPFLLWKKESYKHVVNRDSFSEYQRVARHNAYLAQTAAAEKRKAEKKKKK